MNTIHQEKTFPRMGTFSRGPSQPSTSQGKAWIFGRRTIPQARWRLFCFPNAGGGASVYVPWISGLAPEIDVYPVQLPGRENRLSEQPISRMDELCDALIQALVPHCDRPFAFFGHSMGALISFALTRRLRQRGLPLPAQLFLSAYRAPQIPLEASWHLLPDDELVQKILTLNGTRGEVFANPELRRMLLPIFRADLTLCDTYPYTPEEPLNVPFTIFGGQEDKRAEQKTLEAWRKHTSADFTLHMFPGDHFFWHSNAQPVWQIITQALLASSTVHV